MSAPRWGHVAEWLRNGLQNRVHQFNSGRGLHSTPLKPLGNLGLDLFARRPSYHFATQWVFAGQKSLL
jgi:hypothetical protein